MNEGQSQKRSQMLLTAMCLKPTPHPQMKGCLHRWGGVGGACRPPVHDNLITRFPSEDPDSDDADDDSEGSLTSGATSNKDTDSEVVDGCNCSSINTAALAPVALVGLVGGIIIVGCIIGCGIIIMGCMGCGIIIMGCMGCMGCGIIIICGCWRLPCCIGDVGSYIGV